MKEGGDDPVNVVDCETERGKDLGVLLRASLGELSIRDRQTILHEVCELAEFGRIGYQKPTRNWKLFGFAVFGYAVLTFVYFYRTTGGASSVSVVDGQYVAMYKDQVIRTISENEYRMFPNLWSRVMSAWIGMMALFYLIQSPSMGDSGGADA